MIQFPFAFRTLRNTKKLFIILLSAWFLVNLVQALFMEIISDEAYYGLYGKYLAWGYYDHPPMVALLTRISSLIFSGNLSIRFMTLFLQLGTLLLVWKIIDIKKPEPKVILTFFIIAFSISMFAAYGVITSPDAPLLFFTAMFFLSYKKFIIGQKWTITFLLSLSMAGLVYSKYQAVLVIGFVILSNLKLLKSMKFWAACIFALLLLTPHIYWQVENSFPSFQYHLVDRSENFRWIYLMEYLPNQMAVFNPFTLWAVAMVLFKFRPAGQFEKSLWLQIIGFIGFFMLMAFRGHVEPHWTIACSIPMIILITEKSIENQDLFKYSRKYILPSIILLLAIRIFLMINSGFNRYLGYSGNAEKYKSIESVAGDLPVIFTGSFQKPSLYTFFSGREATVISSVYSRQTQFDIWQFEKKYNNKTVFVCSGPNGKSKVYGSGRLQFNGFRTDSLQTVSRMKIHFTLTDRSFQPGDSIKIPFTLENPYEYDIDFKHREFPVEVSLVLIMGEGKYVLPVSLSEQIGLIPHGTTVVRALSSVIPELSMGNYHLGISLGTFFGPSFNSYFTKIKIVSDD